jgi:hypothetical protein
MLVRGVRLQIFSVAGLSGDLKNAVFLGRFDVCAVPVVPGQIVVHDMANFMQRRSNVSFRQLTGQSRPSRMRGKFQAEAVFYSSWDSV